MKIKDRFSNTKMKKPAAEKIGSDRTTYSAKTDLEAATRGGQSKEMFLKLPQNSQKHNCARASFLVKLQAPPF